MKKIILVLMTMSAFVFAKEYASSITTADKLLCKITHGGPKLSNKSGYDVRPLSDMSVWYINAIVKDNGKTIKFTKDHIVKFKSDTILGNMIYGNGETTIEISDKRDGVDSELTFYDIHIFTNNNEYKNFGHCFLE